MLPEICFLSSVLLFPEHAYPLSPNTQRGCVYCLVCSQSCGDPGFLLLGSSDVSSHC